MKAAAAALLMPLLALVLALAVGDPLAGGQSSDFVTSRTASKRAAALTGISCSSVVACTAVGDYYSGRPLHHGSLVLRWNGKTWYRERSPVIGRASLTTVAVSCPTARRCVAVGTSGAMVWDGTRWKTQPGVVGDSLSCPSGRVCVAVGSTPDDDDLIADIWRDGKWSSEDMPLPTAETRIQSVTLSGVSCTSPVFCMAVGDYSYGVRAQPSPGRRVRTLAEAWNGQGWRIVPPVNPATLSTLKAVSCRSPRLCVAVGTRGTQFTLVERWTGAHWQVQTSPNPSTVGYSTLDAVACPSTHVCEAVGTYDIGASLVAEAWRTDRWSLQRMPRPGTTVSSPAISCPSTDACVAVGMADARPFSQTWNGRTWIDRSTPNPLQ